MRWPIGPKPSCFVCFALFLFPFLVVRRKTRFPHEKGYFCLFFSISLCLSLAFSHSPCSLFLSPSLSCSFLSFFLPSLFSSFFFASCSALFLWFCFMKTTTSKYQIIKFFHQSFLIVCFLSCVVFQIPFSYLGFVPYLKLCILFNINVFIFQEKTPIFSEVGGCNKTFFVNKLYFVKCEKLSLFKFWAKLR